VKIVLIGVAVIALVVVGGLIYLGGLIKVTPKIEKCGGEAIVYKKVKGDYKQSGPVSDEVYEKLLNTYQIETFKGFGTYYDNPQETAKDDLRSIVGCILEEKDRKRVKELENDFEVGVLAEEEYITTTFPFKNKMSILVGVFKVYPALTKYCEENGYEVGTEVSEIWDMPNKTTIYRKKIIKK
jgi:effector-binding domain-containing protein